MNERDHLEDIGIDERIILKASSKTRYENIDWISSMKPNQTKT
jgi:hypothetical protein